MAKAKKKTKKKTKKKVNKPKKSRDVPATQGMLFEARDELKNDISSLGHSIDSRFKAMDSKFKGIDSKFKAMDSKFKAMDSKFDKLMAEIHRIGLLVEDQNSRNKYVLDGYTSLNDRIDKHDKEIAEIKKSINSV